jgi:hypothetical protein
MRWVEADGVGEDFGRRTLRVGLRLQWTFLLSVMSRILDIMMMEMNSCSEEKEHP